MKKIIAIILLCVISMSCVSQYTGLTDWEAANVDPDKIKEAEIIQVQAGLKNRHIAIVIIAIIEVVGMIINVSQMK